ncbi:tetratricopeptide repeat protein [Nonomuraea sp. B19D2]|uniref:tetratricopeptide repeat protein n=1 Tax=Nonomuraea sp. B19D2 TaxID=3159561 RepID=UPI0032DAB720
MDTPQHRLGLERVVEVYSGHDDLVGATGSGYAIGADLVLTSGLAAPPGTPCHVRTPGSGRWAEAEPVWRGRGGAGAVLLRVAGSPWAGVPGIEHVRWARVADPSIPQDGGPGQELRGARFRVRCVARGFPRAERRTGARGAETVSGLVDAPTSAVSKVLPVSVLSPGSDALWPGLSGAALLAEPAGQLIGVIAAGYARNHLDVVPVTALLGDERFRELAGVAPGRLETVAEDEPSAMLADLLIPARDEPPQDCPDWALLMARHAVVPFLGRDEELAHPRTWAAEPAALSIAILTGRSGTGKTRLASELCVELAAAGWDTGFLRLDSAAGPLASRTLNASRPTLLVVDGPESSPPLVGELVRRLAKHGRNPRVRLLLLAREPGEAEWWRRLDTAAGGWLRRLNTTAVQLNTRPLTLQERTEHALAAMKAFAPSRAALPAPPRLDDPEYGLPLHVHLAALLRLCDEGGRAAPSRETPSRGDPSRGGTEADTEPMRLQGGGLFGRFLARESEQWARVWPAEEERVDDVTARQAVAVLTLTAPTPAELPGLLTAVPGLHDRGLQATTMKVARWLGAVFQSGPLGPDLVVEQLLAETDGLDALVLAIHDHEARTAGHLVRLLDVLRRSAHGERARSALRGLIGSRIGELVAEAAANPATRLGDMLNAALALFPADRALAASASALLARTGSAAEPPARPGAAPMRWGASPVRRGAGLGLRALDVTLGELAVRHRRATGERMALAGALSWLSGRLTAVGRAGEAVVAAAEAVDIYGAAAPYEAAAGRADALFNLGACLLLAGEPGSALKPAQEAAARFRILAEDDPWYAGEAARAHHNVACALLEVGRLDEAVEAFEAAGGDAGFAADLAALAAAAQRRAHPGPATAPPLGAVRRLPTARSRTAHQPPTTRSGTTGHPPAAGFETAGRAWMGRSGMVEQPPVAAVPGPGPLMPFEETDAAALPELAGCLSVAVTAAVKNVAPTNTDLAHRLRLLAAWLEEHGRPADAVVPVSEAVVRLRGLAVQEPGLRLMLAEAAGLLAGLHARLEDLDAAVRSAAEAVRNLRALAALEPDEHRHALTGQLLRLGELLLIDDRPEKALGPLREAMSVAAEPYAPTQAERHTVTQAEGRRLLGFCLDELGRPADSLAQLELAAERYDVLGAEDGFHLRHASEARARAGRLARRAEHAGGRPWLLALVTERPEEAVAGAERQLAECRQAAESGGTPKIHAYISAQAMLARAWTDVGRPGDGLVLARQAAELLRRHPVPDPPRQPSAGPERPHAIAVGMVAAALGRALVCLGRHKEAIPHLRAAIESYEPRAGTSVVFRTELAELLILEIAALSDAACPADAEEAADRLVELYTGLVSEGLASRQALAGALRLQGGISLTRQNVEGARRSVTRALEESEAASPLLTATCLELDGLCLAELQDPAAARSKLAEGIASMPDPPPPDLVDVHLLALARLAGLRVEEEGPAAGVTLYRQLLDIRPLPGTDALRTLAEEIAAYPGDLAELLPALATFAEALEREVPLSGGGAEVHDLYGRSLMRVPGAEPAVRVYRGLAAFSGDYRGRLGLALAALARQGDADLDVMEQAIQLLSAQPGRELAETLNLYAVKLLEQGRPVEALAHSERAADLCDELDDPAVAAVTYAQLGAGLAMLDRTQAALEAITWSLAELDRAAEAGREPPGVRAQALQVRGQVLRASGREQEALAHLVEALRLHTDPARKRATAAQIADVLLAAAKPEEAAEYARIAVTGHEPGTVKHALATQRLVRCLMMLGELTEANALVEDLIPLARRSPDDLTYRAVLADSLAQSSELLPLLGLDGGMEAESRAREAIAIYDELLTTGMDAQALHTSRAGACLTLASALRMRNLAADAIQPLREAVAALERFGPVERRAGPERARASSPMPAEARGSATIDTERRFGAGSRAGQETGPGSPIQRELLSRAMLMLGDALMEAGRALEAGLVFHRAAQVTRDELPRAVAHARLGFCQQELGRDDAADAALRFSAGLLRGLILQDGVADLLRDVLRGRLKLLERAGKGDELAAIEDELRRLTA